MLLEIGRQHGLAIEVLADPTRRVLARYGGDTAVAEDAI